MVTGFKGGRCLLFFSFACLLQHLVDEEEIRKKGAQVNQGIQVIDQLRADRPLSEHKLYGRPGASGVSVDYLDKGVVRLCRSKALLINQRLEQIGQSFQGIFGVLKLGADLCPRAALFVAGDSLRGVRKHELVGRFDDLDALLQPAA